MERAASSVQSSFLRSSERSAGTFETAETIVNIYARSHHVRSPYLAIAKAQMLIGYAWVSKAGGGELLDSKHDALVGVGIAAERI